MTAPITRLFALVTLLFALLVVFTTRWTVIDAKSLRNQPLNRRQLLEEARIRRGVVRADDGTVLARSVRGQGGVYHRTYPMGEMFGHAVGYAYTNLGRAGLEQFRNDALTGQGSQFGSSILDQLSGKRREGDDVTTTLDPRTQRVALDSLRGERGAVVALDPRTGAVKAMVSTPTFDPNAVPRPGRFAALNRQSGSPLFNRATQAAYPPGSTFKVVTDIAAIDSGRYSPDSTVSGRNNKPISGVPLSNDNGEDFGDIDLTTALTHSVNTVWAEVAENVGKRTMGSYMQRLGFYAKPPLDYPSGERRASGEYLPGGTLLSPVSDRIDVGRMGIGQDKLAVTPLQMAMVAAAVANGGKLVRPHLTERIVDSDGRTVEDFGGDTFSRVMSRSTADAVKQMMSNVVREGTGTAAALSGIDVAGKTGTAENGDGTNQVWFIALAPLDRPRVAVAVTLERSSGTGGEVAAPIAKRVMEALLNR
jgi:peptidoglycan glycosyltransferase